MDVNTWLDKYGLLHLNENPDFEQSENPILFTSNLVLFQKLNKQNHKNFYLIKAISNRVRAFSKIGKGLSHDEYTGYVCALLNHPDIEFSKFIRKKIQIFSWKRMHPRDIIFYGLVKFPILFLILKPLLSFIMMISCGERYKYRNGRKILKTDGKILSLLRCKSLGMNFTYMVCTWLIEDDRNFKSWTQVYEIYFKDPAHPNRYYAELLENKGFI